MTDQHTTEVANVANEAFAPAEFQQQVTAPTTKAIQRLEAEARAMDIAYGMALRLSKTTAVPQRYQQSYIPKNHREPLGITAAYNLAAAIMYGAELGMSALQSAQNVFEVHGTPAVYSKTMVAQVRQWIDARIAQGLTTAGDDKGDDVWEVSASPERVVWAARRNGKTAASEWTIQRAETAGFTKNEKYQKQPTEMLRAKAQAEVCRILFQDVLLGMSHTVEELQLEEGLSVQVARPAARQRGVSGLQSMLAERNQVIEPAERPLHPSEPGPADQNVDPPPAPSPDPAPAKPATKRAITDVKRLLASVEKLTDPKAPETLQMVGSLLEREVTDLDTLTADEAASLISVLNTPTTAPKEN